jgi:hypothetical protein
MWHARRGIDDILVGTQPVLTSEPVVESFEGSHAAPSGWGLAPRLSPRQAFAALAVFALILRLASTTGLIGSDDLHYAKYAQAILEGNFAETVDQTDRKHHALRYAVILPLAATYSVFGVSEWSTIVLPLVASTLSVLLLAAIARRLFGMRVAIIAALLYATFPMQLRLAGMMLPEPIAGFYVLAGVLVYLSARSRARSWSWLAAGVLMGVAYLAKEPALFVGGAFLLHALWERQWRGAMLLAAGLASVLLAEHAYYYFVRGDLLFRPHSTQLYRVDTGGAFFSAVAEGARLPYRLLWKYPEAMLVPDLRFGLHSLFAVVLAASAFFFRPRRGYMMLLLWAAVPWLYLNFGTWNFTRYAPLPADPRYIELVYPPLMVLAAIGLNRALEARAAISRTAMVSLLVVMVTGVGVGVTVRGQTANAGEMSVLREIVRASQALPPHSIYTDSEDWRRALAVLDRSRISPTREGASIILIRHRFGFPAVETTASPEEHPTRNHPDEEAER